MQPIVVPVQQNPIHQGSSYKWQKVNTKALNILGSLQIIVGILCVILDAVGIILTPRSYKYDYFHFGHGIWCGIFFVIVGVVGLVAAFYRKSSQVVGYMVMSIIAAGMFVPVMVALDALALDSLTNRRYISSNTQIRYDYDSRARYPDYYGDSPAYVLDMDHPLVKMTVGLHSGLMACAIMELIFAVLGAAFCCYAMRCCSSSAQQPSVSYMQPGTQQVVMLPAGGSMGQQYFLQSTATPQYVAQPQGGIIQQNGTPQYVAQGAGGMMMQPPPYVPQQATYVQPGQLQQRQLPQTQQQGRANPAYVPDGEMKTRI